MAGHLLELDQFRFAGELPEPIAKNLEAFFVVQSGPKRPCLVQHIAKFLAFLPAAPFLIELAPQFLRLHVCVIQFERVAKRGGRFRQRSFRQSLFGEPQLLLHLLRPRHCGFHFGEQMLR